MTYKGCVPGPWPLSDNNLKQSPLSLHSRHAGPSSVLSNPRHAPQGLCIGFFLPEMHFFLPNGSQSSLPHFTQLLPNVPPAANPSLKNLSHQSYLPCGLSSKHFLSNFKCIQLQVHLYCIFGILKSLILWVNIWFGTLKLEKVKKLKVSVALVPNLPSSSSHRATKTASLLCMLPNKFKNIQIFICMSLFQHTYSF